MTVEADDVTSRQLERRIVLTVAGVQFINIVDFMMVTPLGPFFAAGLHIPTSNLALIAAMYTATAGLAGIAGSFFLDRFDRRTALTFAMVGLVVGTFLGGFATGMGTLLAARAVAGLFGGPATALSMSIIADVVPVQRRGRAMSTVMTAFSAASILGVPGGLVLAELGGWRLPFFALAATGVLFIAGGRALLPPLRGHLDRPHTRSAFSELLTLVSRPIVRRSYLMTAAVMLAGFLLIPNLPVYLVANLGLPSPRLKWLYLAGGISSIVTLRVAGQLVDRFGSFKVGLGAAGFLALQLYFYVVHFIPGTPIWAMFVAFMIAMNLRNVSYNTLASRVPEAHERARFQSIQSAVQHSASALGGAVSSWILVELPDGKLSRLDQVAWVSIALTAVVPLLLFIVERALQDRPRQPLGLTGPTPVAGPAGPPVAPTGTPRAPSG